MSEPSHGLPAALSGVALKLDRADHHLEAIKGEIAKFDHGPDVIPGEYEPQTKTHVFRARHDPPAPTALSAPIGEFLYNVRCALDYIVFELLTAAGKPVDNRKSFPIYIDPGRPGRTSRARLVACRNERKHASSGCSRSTDRIAIGFIPSGATPRGSPSRFSSD